MAVTTPFGKLVKDTRVYRHGMNLWPPFWGAGVHIAEIAPDWSKVVVQLRWRRTTRNAVGTQFGGSVFAMTDPFWMIMLLHELGRDHVVWDKAAEIDFVNPGRTRLTATFEIGPAVIDEIRTAAADNSKVLRWFDLDVVDDDGTVVAHIRKQVYIRRKRPKNS